MRNASCLSLTVFTLLLGASHAADLDPLNGLFPPEAAAVVKSPATVTAWRLGEGSTYRAKVADYRTVGDAVEVDAETAKALAEVLLHPRSYLWDEAKGCDPIYGVRIQFQRNDEKVDVVFCFECSILSVYRGGEAIASEDFDPIRAPLVAAMKRIFPEDGEIQSLNSVTP